MFVYYGDQTAFARVVIGLLIMALCACAVYVLKLLACFFIANPLILLGGFAAVVVLTLAYFVGKAVL